jgi:D-serine deaminase-like pyridoxal phosphate-dependent protein
VVTDTPYPLAPPAVAGMPVADVDTPALLLDLDAFEANVRTMAAAVAASGVRLRPHAKAHKCAEIARRQVAAGAVGICCQKVSEAEAMVAGGIHDVLVANEVVGTPKLARLATLASRARVAVCVDDAANATDVSRAAQAAGVSLDVLVEVDVGGRRCGVAPGEPALRLAQHVRSLDGLHFAGLQAYDGSSQHLRSVEERRAAVARAIEHARATRDLLAGHGIECATITGAGTGTFIFEGASEVYTEVQPGSYVFMDADYGRNAWDGFPVFRQSLHVWTTVMSTPAPHRVVVDAGMKSHSIDSGMPLVAGWPDLFYVNASDEHGVLEREGGAPMPRLGATLRLVPGHCDPTVNLHDWIVCVRGSRVEAVWPVSARGAFY